MVCFIYGSNTLDGNAGEDVFKVYMRDCGLFVSMLEDSTQYNILQGKLYGYKGAIFENLIADIFVKMGRKLYYFHKDSGLEVDFVIRYKDECTLVEVKSTPGNAKSKKQYCVILKNIMWAVLSNWVIIMLDDLGRFSCFRCIWLFCCVNADRSIAFSKYGNITNMLQFKGCGYYPSLHG